MRSYKDILLQAKRHVKEISDIELFKMIDKNSNILLLDVREIDEHQQGYIPTAEFLPRGMLELYIEKIQADRNHEIIVYCENGFRSILAADTLQHMGYKNVKSLIGGFKVWKDKGYLISNIRAD